MELPCQVTSHAIVFAAVTGVLSIAQALVEYWLGKTSKVKSASILELVLTGAAAIAVLILRRKTNDPDGKGL